MATYTYEVSGPKNEQLLFAPLRRKIRGRWNVANAANRDRERDTPQGMCMREIASNVPVIPGVCIQINTTKMVGGFFDPLEESPEGKAIWQKLSAILARFNQPFGDGQMKPWPKDIKKLTHDQIKTWAYCMRQAVDSGYLHPVSGTSDLPELEEIKKWEGKRDADPNRHTAYSGKEKEYPQFVDEVPVKRRKLKDEETNTETVGAGGSTGS